MHISRFVAAGAAALLALGFGIAQAGPAAAATASPSALESIDPLCILWTSLPANPQTATVTGYVGDTFTVNFASGECISYGYSTATGTPASPSNGTLTDGVPQTFTITGSGQMDFGISLTLTVEALTSPTPPTTTGPAPLPIPDWVQAYGRAGKDAACQDAWGQSWQKWAEPVTGGWVCTRTIPSLG